MIQQSLKISEKILSDMAEAAPKSMSARVSKITSK